MNSDDKWFCSFHEIFFICPKNIFSVFADVIRPFNCHCRWHLCCCALPFATLQMEYTYMNVCNNCRGYLQPRSMHVCIHASYHTRVSNSFQGGVDSTRKQQIAKNRLRMINIVCITAIHMCSICGYVRFHARHHRSDNISILCNSFPYFISRRQCFSSRISYERLCHSMNWSMRAKSLLINIYTFPMQCVIAQIPYTHVHIMIYISLMLMASHIHSRNPSNCTLAFVFLFSFSAHFNSLATFNDSHTINKNN